MSSQGLSSPTGFLSLENEACRSFAFCVIILIIKLFALVPLIGYWRQRKGVYLNQEDVAPFYSGSGDPAKIKPIYTDPDVERVRRNHLNDLENIPAFIFVGLLYLLIGPPTSLAIWHFRIFTFSRVSHTLAYQLKLQPWRACCQIIGLLATVSMALQVLWVVM